MPKENIIISLGGSLVAPADIDTVFIKVFRNTLKKFFESHRFFVFVGGGKICRNYQKAMLEFGADNTERDVIGIDISRLNARVVKQAFSAGGGSAFGGGDAAFAQIITNPSKPISTRKDVVVAGGWKPGWSTDYCAVTLAKNMGIKTIINITNVDYVYDRDPKNPTSLKLRGARAFKEVSWKEFRKLVGNKWSPGLSVPFDPRASREAELLKIRVIVINGKHIERLEQFLKGKEFIGTTIT